MDLEDDGFRRKIKEFTRYDEGWSSRNEDEKRQRDLTGQEEKWTERV